MEKTSILIIVATTAFILGYIIKLYNISLSRISGFIRRKIFGSPKTYGPWAIGIYEGATPFELKEPAAIKNPVISGSDVTDFDASFVADPFIIQKNDTYFMFFEALQRDTQKGVISYATSSDGYHWQYQKTVIEEPFHLSYPYIFEWNDEYYIIPESNEDYSVRLYKAKRFPEEWECIHTLLSGFDFVDPSIFRHNGLWWMFVSTSNSDFVNLYFSNYLENGWTPHPKNPITKHNKHISRPGGRVLQFDNKLFRLAQDTYPVYGKQLFAFEIEKLSTTEYSEKQIDSNPILRSSTNRWNLKGMHQMDVIKKENIWIAAVDGRWT